VSTRNEFVLVKVSPLFAIRFQMVGTRQESGTTPRLNASLGIGYHGRSTFPAPRPSCNSHALARAFDQVRNGGVHEATDGSVRIICGSGLVPISSHQLRTGGRDRH
jgi:hypothetical protein